MWEVWAAGVYYYSIIMRIIIIIDILMYTSYKCELISLLSLLLTINKKIYIINHCPNFLSESTKKNTPNPNNNTLNVIYKYFMNSQLYL